MKGGGWRRWDGEDREGVGERMGGEEREVVGRRKTDGRERGGIGGKRNRVRQVVCINPTCTYNSSTPHLTHLTPHTTHTPHRVIFGNLVEVRGDRYANIIDSAPPQTFIIMHIYDEVRLHTQPHIPGSSQTFGCIIFTLIRLTLHCM